MTMTVHNSPPPFSTVPICAAHLGRDGSRSPTMPRATPTICMIAISTAKPMAVINGMSAAAKSMWLMGRVGFKDSTIRHAAQVSPNAPPNVKHEPIPNPECRISNITCGRTPMLTEPPPTRPPFRNGPSGASVQHFVLHYGTATPASIMVLNHAFAAFSHV
jgi:hypothetical protein